MGARLRKGDEVIVISGKEKGKKGRIKALDDMGRVYVEGLNLIKRHTRPTPRNPSGGIIEKEAPLHASKVMPVDPATGKGTRVHFKVDEKSNKKVRLAKSGEEIPVPKAE